MYLRGYQSSDAEELASLFYDTVHRVNRKEYTQEQVDAWAAGQIDLDAWDRSLQEHITLVAVEQERLVGFGDIDYTGYLDRLFVHADHQGRGIATALCDVLEHSVPGPVTTHASLTAKPFFEARGYRVLAAQQVVRRGVELPNYVMRKESASPVRQAEKRFDRNLRPMRTASLSVGWISHRNRRKPRSGSMKNGTFQRRLIRRVWRTVCVGQVQFPNGTWPWRGTGSWGDWG